MDETRRTKDPAVVPKKCKIVIPRPPEVETYDHLDFYTWYESKFKGEWPEFHDHPQWGRHDPDSFIQEHINDNVKWITELVLEEIKLLGDPSRVYLGGF
jgi:hypothetical protein